MRCRPSGGRAVADVSGTTLMMAIQAVHAQVRHYESLLKSETLRDAAEIQSLILSYENAARALEHAYRQERVNGSNLPEYETLVRE
jgi:hypothetical protein